MPSTIDPHTVSEIVVDPVESAKVAGLRYATQTASGIRRRRVGKAFPYIGPDGRRVRDAATSRGRSSAAPASSATRRRSRASATWHPAVPDAYLDGVTVRTLQERTERRIGESVRGLSAEEGVVLGLLQQRLARQADTLRARRRAA